MTTLVMRMVYRILSTMIGKISVMMIVSSGLSDPWMGSPDLHGARQGAI
jgi:hypothetical protein